MSTFQINDHKSNDHMGLDVDDEATDLLDLGDLNTKGRQDIGAPYVNYK